MVVAISLAFFVSKQHTQLSETRMPSGSQVKLFEFCFRVHVLGILSRYLACSLELHFPLLFSYHSPNYQVSTTFNLSSKEPLDIAKRKFDSKVDVSGIRVVL